ncbi:hypothetical protein O181_006009 [Austropuccinia psidii MF-1]|uniref:Uncharacterized protein n=1 Tax=Austropuccinia psidii MF-1 TaxID=1389203 RepID=A0A9Q3BJ85_9BASI|nr:hypothetical protein [Austropuccinia psidii MF-1]
MRVAKLDVGLLRIPDLMSRQFGQLMQRWDRKLNWRNPAILIQICLFSSINKPRLLEPEILQATCKLFTIHRRMTMMKEIR